MTEDWVSLSMLVSLPTMASRSGSSKAVATAIIIAVVAVLLIHMDRNQVDNMKLSINLQ